MIRGDSPVPVAGNGAARILRTRHAIMRAIRTFFDSRGYVEVETPLRVRCPGIDPYIDAVPAGPDYYLATSPELQMKQIIGNGIDRLYQIGRAFRAGESGRLHRTEFTMLEWYRTGADYHAIMQETENLMAFMAAKHAQRPSSWQFPFRRITVDDLYEETAGWRPSRSWNEDRYFQDWVDRVDPFLSSCAGVFVVDFPAPLASLSRIKEDDQRLCERFELFVRGIEIGNAFTELTDYDEHLSRFKCANDKRRMMGKEPYAADEGFLRAVKAGMPECGGIAVGVDRLIMALLESSCMEDVLDGGVVRDAG